MFYYRILFVVLAQNKALARKIPDTSRKRNDLNPEYEAETLNPTSLWRQVIPQSWTFYLSPGLLFISYLGSIDTGFID